MHGVRKQGSVVWWDALLVMGGVEVYWLAMREVCLTMGALRLRGCLMAYLVHGTLYRRHESYLFVHRTYVTLCATRESLAYNLRPSSFLSHARAPMTSAQLSYVLPHIHDRTLICMSCTDDIVESRRD